MAIFQSLANSLRILAIGHRVKVTLRPETGRFPNPLDGHITEKDDQGNLSIKCEQGIVQVRPDEILSITRLPG
jgi:hypothetical protein